MNLIKPIETTYAGCRFRSRLEARWAVFFDALRIEWQYEPQGYLIGESREPYLPDFYLPERTVYVEVKGNPTQRDLDLVIAAAEPEELGGLPGNHDENGLNVLVLADIPRPDGGCPLHIGLGPRWDKKVRTILTAWAATPEGVRLVMWPSPVWPIRPDTLTRPASLHGVIHSHEVMAAYEAARGARFEHGESGAW